MSGEPNMIETGLCRQLNQMEWRRLMWLSRHVHSFSPKFEVAPILIL